MTAARIGIALLPLLLPALGGCASTRGTEVLEARLREQEDVTARLRSRLQRLQSELDVARNYAASLRSELAGRGAPVIRPEQARSLFSVAGVRVSGLLTGPLDQDGRPGDELLAAVVVPHDEQGSLVKLPGDVEIELLDLSRPRDRQRVGYWEFTAEETRENWHGGLFGSGYLFHLPWQQVPQSPELVLHARLTTADGRQFHTTHEIAVDPNRIVANEHDSERPLPFAGRGDAAATPSPEQPAEPPPFRRASTTRSLQIGQRPAGEVPLRRAPPADEPDDAKAGKGPVLPLPGPAPPEPATTP